MKSIIIICAMIAMIVVIAEGQPDYCGTDIASCRYRQRKYCCSICGYKKCPQFYDESVRNEVMGFVKDVVNAEW